MQVVHIVQVPLVQVAQKTVVIPPLPIIEMALEVILFSAGDESRVSVRTAMWSLLECVWEERLQH